MDRVTHQKRREKGWRTRERETERDEKSRGSLDGEVEKQERCTHSRPSLGLDWKRSSGRNWSLFLFRRLWREKKGIRSMLSFRETSSQHEQRRRTHMSLGSICVDRPGGWITLPVSGFTVQRLNSWESLSGFLWSWPAGYRAVFVCVCQLQVIVL